MREHRQGDVSAPAVVTADLVLVQADLTLGGLEGLLDGPAGAGDSDQFTERGAFGTVAQVVGQVVGIGQAASDQQPVAAGVLQRTDLGAGPVVLARALRAGAGGDLPPTLCR